MEAGVWVTVTEMEPEAAPEVAVMVAVPFPRAVTRPPNDTSATPELLLVQDTETPLMTFPFWSFT
jgi:hypothetical protein